jgi:hypothetical protein
MKQRENKFIAMFFSLFICFGRERGELYIWSLETPQQIQHHSKFFSKNACSGVEKYFFLWNKNPEYKNEMKPNQEYIH